MNIILMTRKLFILLDSLKQHKRTKRSTELCSKSRGILPSLWKQSSSALVSTIILAVQRVSVVSYSYRGQARKRRDTAWRLSLWLQQNCPGNNEFTDQPVCKSPDLLNFIFEEKDRLLWIFLKVCRSVRLIQSSVIMLLTKSWSPDIFNSKSKECTQNSYFLYNSNITLKRFWVKWVTKQQNTA